MKTSIYREILITSCAICISFLFILFFTKVKGQGSAPFGTPPGTTYPSPNQTPDNIYNNTFSNTATIIYSQCLTSNWIDLSRTFNTGCPEPSLFDEIENTGNDIQKFEILNNLTVKAQTWDGNYPSFSVQLNDQNGAEIDHIILPLMGNVHGTINDPDIIIGQIPFEDITNPDEFLIPILCVYELHIGTDSWIAVEQWNYRYDLSNPSQFGSIKTNNFYGDQNSGVDRLVINTQSTDNPSNNNSNPNIDGNDDNQIAIVYQAGDQNSEIVLRTGQINTPQSATIGQSYYESMKAHFVRDKSNKVGKVNFKTPDVTLTDHNDIEFQTIVSLVFNEEPNNTLQIAQEEINDLSSSPNGYYYFNTYYKTGYESLDKPRIASPSKFSILKEYECAVTSINDFKPYALTNRNQTNFHYIDPVNSSILDAPIHEKPAITYSRHHEGEITVGWNTIAGSLYGRTSIAVNFLLQAGNYMRTPSNNDYFMLINQQGVYDDEFSVSLSGLETNLNRTFYTNITTEGTQNPDYNIVYKTSDVINQPFIRKGTFDEEDLTSDQSAKLSLNYFPNPAQELVNIQVIEGAVNLLTVYNVNGVKVRELSINPEQSDILLKIEDLTPGLYFMEFRNQKQDRTMKKLIVE